MLVAFVKYGRMTNRQLHIVHRLDLVHYALREGTLFKSDDGISFSSPGLPSTSCGVLGVSQMVAVSETYHPFLDFVWTYSIIRIIKFEDHKMKNGRTSAALYLEGDGSYHHCWGGAIGLPFAS